MSSIRKRSWSTKSKSKKKGVAFVVDYRDAEGDRHHKQFRTLAEAKDFETTIRHDLQEGTHTPDRKSQTVAEFGRLWLAAKGTEGLEPTTIAQYRQHLQHHIDPRLGAVKLSQLKAPTVEAFRLWLHENGRSKQMQRKVIGSLRNLLNYAQRHGMVSHNVAKSVRVEISRADKKPRLFPSKEDVRTILDAADDRWRPLLLTLVFTGIRISEARGLRWDNVDLRTRIVRIRQRADNTHERTIGLPKSRAGERQIPLAPEVVAALTEWRLRCPPNDRNLVFPAADGGVEDYWTIYRYLSNLQRACGVVDKEGKPKYGIHAFRHFFASWAIEQGFAHKKLQDMMGHGSIQMTFDLYGNLFPSLEDDHAKFEAGQIDILGR